ncbi:MAG: hypothetical protein ACYTEX_10975 [Planctomycetota bacterium]|jgi:hypothetical protein
MFDATKAAAELWDRLVSKGQTVHPAKVSIAADALAEAYRAGQEEMRVRAAGTVYHVTSLVPCVTLDKFAAAIRALSALSIECERIGQDSPEGGG